MSSLLSKGLQFTWHSTPLRTPASSNSSALTMDKMTSSFFSKCLLLTTLVNPATTLSLPSCNNSLDHTHLCAKFSNYSEVDYPEPFPIKIRTTFTIDDILNIDEDLQVIHVLLTLNAQWSEDRILLKIPAEQNKPK